MMWSNFQQIGKWRLARNQWICPREQNWLVTGLNWHQKPCLLFGPQSFQYMMLLRQNLNMGRKTVNKLSTCVFKASIPTQAFLTLWFLWCRETLTMYETYYFGPGKKTKKKQDLNQVEPKIMQTKQKDKCRSYTNSHPTNSEFHVIQAFICMDLYRNFYGLKY